MPRLRRARVMGVCFALSVLFAAPAVADTVKIVVPFAAGGPKVPLVAERLKAGGVYGTLDGKAFAARLDREFNYWAPQLKKLGINAE